MRKGSGSVETDWDDESEQTHALEFKTLAPWYVPEMREGEFDGARELSWEATLNELVEATDAPRMYESHSRPIAGRAGNARADNSTRQPSAEPQAAPLDAAFPSGMWCAPHEDTPSCGVAAPEESTRSETRRTRTRGEAVRPAMPLPEAANDLHDPPPFAAGPEPQRDSMYDQSELRAPRWLWLFAAAMTVLVIGLTLRLWLLTMSEVSGDEPIVQSMGSGFMLSRRDQTGFVIDTRPSGAEVHVDGSSTGLITPARIQHLTAGAHAIQLKLHGYSDTELRAVLENGVTADLPDVVLRPLAPPARPVEPARVEPAPAEPAVASVHPPQFLPPATASAEDDARAASGVQRRLPAAESEPGGSRARVRTLGDSPSGTGVLQITSRPWAHVFVDGRFAGETPQRGLRLQAGTHAIRLVNDELSMRRSFKLTVRRGQTIAKFVDLQ